MWALLSHMFCNCTFCTHLPQSAALMGNHTRQVRDFFADAVTGLSLPFDCSFCCHWTAGEILFYLSWTVLFVLLVLTAYYVLYTPLNIVKDLSDVGFDYLKDGTYMDARNLKRKKRDLVKEVQRMRQVGDLPPVFPNGWFALLESQDVKKKQVRHVAALGENFAVFRSEKGKVHVLDAYCPHLGANMAIGGVVRGDCLECPFHNWSFEGSTGRCTSVPYADKTPVFVKAKKWLCVDANNFIFIWYHAEGEEPTWTPKDRIESEKWSYRGRTEFLVGSHIQDIPENGADVAHLNAIHRPNVMAGDDLRRYERPHWQFLHHVWNAQWRQSEEEPHKGLMDLTMESRVLNKISLGGKIVVRVEQIGPGYVELNMATSWGPMLLLQTVTPVEPMLQRVIHRIYGPPNPLQGLAAKLTLYMEAIMFGRDVMVWNHKTYIGKPRLVKEDKTIAKHRRWYSQFYSQNSPRFTFRKDTLDW